MNKCLVAAVSLALLSLSSLVTASPEEDYEAKCKAWAVEDSIAEDAMASYIEECVAQLQQEAQEDAAGQAKDTAN